MLLHTAMALLGNIGDDIPPLSCMSHLVREKNQTQPMSANRLSVFLSSQFCLDLQATPVLLT